MSAKYESQQKNLQKNYVRFPLDLKPDVLATFRQACKANGTTPTTEIKNLFLSTFEMYVESTKAGNKPRFSFAHMPTSPAFSIPAHLKEKSPRIAQVEYSGQLHCWPCLKGKK